MGQIHKLFFSFAEWGHSHTYVKLTLANGCLSESKGVNKTFTVSGKANSHLGFALSSTWVNWETLTGKVGASTNSKDMWVVDPSNRLQTSKLSSVCVTSCTAHIQYWQAIVICLHSLMWVIVSQWLHSKAQINAPIPPHNPAEFATLLYFVQMERTSDQQLFIHTWHKQSTGERWTQWCNLVATFINL